MANTKKSSKQYTAEETKAYREAQRAAQAEMLASAVDALTSEQGWLRYLRAAHMFHDYSFNNRILIALQCPEATQVMGAGDKTGKTGWKALGRFPVKGSKAIRILGPVMVKDKDANGAVKLDGNGKPVLKCVGFKSLPVFDVSQTDGDPLPEAPAPEPITGESHEEYLYRAEALWESMGYEVDYDALVGTDKRGSVSLAEKKVRINGTMALNAQVRTHMHELAHAIGGIDYAAYTRQQAEVIVESAAFIACGMVGLDTTGMSVPYVTTWGADAEDPKHALKLMKEFTNVIDTLAEAIVEGIS